MAPETGGIVLCGREVVSRQRSLTLYPTYALVVPMYSEVCAGDFVRNELVATSSHPLCEVLPLQNVADIQA